MKEHELVNLQIELEYRLGPQRRLIPFPGSTEQSRFIVYEVPGKFVRFFRQDLPDAICNQLEAIPGESALSGSDAVRAVLSSHAPCGPVWRGRSYFFPLSPTPGIFQSVTREHDRFVVVDSDEVVSWSFSARENDACAELAVETLPAFRRRGFAKATASAWAAAVINTGKVAFFSHSHDNRASEALAQSLRVQDFTTAAAYD